MTARQVSIALQSDKSPGHYAALGPVIEDYGFDAVSVYADLMYQPPLLPLLTIASRTKRIRLGPACLNPYLLHPVEIAGQAAALDVASSGRAYLGLARGSWLDQVGVQQRRPLTTMREAVEVVRRLLAGDDSGFCGDVFHLQPGLRLRYDVARPSLDLLIGAWGPKGVALAGELAEEIKIGGSANPDIVPYVSAHLAEGRRAAAGPRPECRIALGAVTVVDDDGDAARERAAVEVAMYLAVVGGLDPTVQVPPDLLERVRDLVARDEHTAAARLLPRHLLDRFAFAGTPREVADHALALFAAGADRVEFGTPHGLDADRGIELLGREVLPRIRAS